MNPYLQLTRCSKLDSGELTAFSGFLGILGVAPMKDLGPGYPLYPDSYRDAR